MNTETSNIRTVLTNYAFAVDTRNDVEAGKYMDSNFRVVLNNYKNLPEPTVLSKEQYLNMMQAGKIGGTTRTVSFEFVDSNESVAIAKLRLEGEKAVFNTYYHLIRKREGWFILSDTPQITAK